jgi:hypothetical protein
MLEPTCWFSGMLQEKVWKLGIGSVVQEINYLLVYGTHHDIYNPPSPESWNVS